MPEPDSKRYAEKMLYCGQFYYVSSHNTFFIVCCNDFSLIRCLCSTPLYGIDKLRRGGNSIVESNESSSELICMASLCESNGWQATEADLFQLPVMDDSNVLGDLLYSLIPSAVAPMR